MPAKVTIERARGRSERCVSPSAGEAGGGGEEGGEGQRIVEQE
jgi:hypothetical protein